MNDLLKQADEIVAATYPKMMYRDRIPIIVAVFHQLCYSSSKDD